MASVTITKTLEEVRRTLSDLARQGIKGVDLPSETMAVLGRWGTAEGLNEPHVHRPEGAVATESLEQIREDLGECQRCPLGKARNHLVFGAGDPGARLVFVGEAPGYDEDLQGIPFVGAAGKLLTRIIEAMGLTRKDVYICNILKCRPPGNRNPLPEETEMCTPFLNRQLAAISPECICALGKFAAQHLHGSQTPISRLRGRFFDYNGIQVMPTYHPAYLLRNPEGKRDVWNDVQQIMKVLGIKAPRK